MTFACPASQVPPSGRREARKELEPSAASSVALRPNPGRPVAVQAASTRMVAVQFAVLLLRLLRLPLGTQLTAPQNFSPVDAAGRLSSQPPTLLLPDADSGTLRQLQPAPKRRPALATRLAAEATGTAFIVGGGCGAACALRDATSVSSYTMPVLWGVAVATAVTTLRESSGAHFNPAVTLAFYCYNRDGGMASSPGVISAYIAAQCTGATLASLAMASWFAPNVAATQVRRACRARRTLFAPDAAAHDWLSSP